MRHRFPGQLQRYVREAFEAPFAANGAELVAGPDLASAFTPAALAAVVGLTADGFRGSLVLALEADTLAATHPLVMADPSATVEAKMLADWAGEIANLAAGHLKSLLMSHDITVKISPPSVSAEADGTLAQYIASKPSQQFWFSVEGHPLCCQLSVEIAPRYDFEAA